MPLHDALHVDADFARMPCAGRVADAVQPVNCPLGGRIRQRWMRLYRVHDLDRAAGRGPAKNQKIDQRIGAKTVGTMHRHAGPLADRHKAGNDAFRITVTKGDDLAVQIGRDSAHIVVNRGRTGISSIELAVRLDIRTSGAPATS